MLQSPCVSNICHLLCCTYDHRSEGGLVYLPSSTSAGTAADILPLLKSVRGMSLMDSPTPPLGMRGHYIDTKPNHRRMTAVGSNQNKAITKRLASASHYQQVLTSPVHSLGVSVEVLQTACRIARATLQGWLLF